MRARVLAISALVLLTASLMAWAGPQDQMYNTALYQLKEKVDKAAFRTFSTNTHQKIAAVTVNPVFVNGTTVTLPRKGEVVYIKKDSTAKPLTLVPAAGQTVDNDSNYSLTVQGESVHLKLIGTNWSKL